MLKIINSTSKFSFELSREMSSNLEECLNMSRLRNDLKDIGHILHEYGNGHFDETFFLEVNEKQFDYLNMLYTKETWRECSKL
jgi:hypothetical protein